MAANAVYDLIFYPLIRGEIQPLKDIDSG